MTAEYAMLKEVLTDGLRIMRQRFQDARASVDERLAEAYGAQYELAWSVVATCLHDLEDRTHGFEVQSEKAADIASIAVDGLRVLPIPTHGPSGMRWTYALTSESEIDGMLARTASVAYG